MIIPMDSASSSLPNDPEKLKAELIKLQDAIKAKEQRIEQLLDYVLLLRKRQFGASADRPNKDQFNLFDEAELEQLLAELDIPEANTPPPACAFRTDREDHRSLA